MDIELGEGLHLHVRTVGESEPTTLLVHGWAVSGRVWEPIVARWPASAGRLLVVDLRGTGFSSKPRDGYTLDTYVSDIITLIDKMKLSNLTLVGHSMGGAIAQRIALQRADTLSKLVLLCPVPASGVPLSDKDIGYFRSLGGHRAGAEQTVRMVMHAQVPADRMESLVQCVATVAIEAFLGGFDAWRTASFGDQIHAINTPTLVIGGEKDPALTPDFLQPNVVSKIPGARFVAMTGVGHYPQQEAPDELVKLLSGEVGKAA